MAPLRASPAATGSPKKRQQDPNVRKEIYRRWNILIRRVFRRIESLRAQDNLERWTRLLVGIQSQQPGRFELKGPETMGEKQARERKEKALRITAKWLRFTLKL